PLDRQPVAVGEPHRHHVGLGLLAHHGDAVRLVAQRAEPGDVVGVQMRVDRLDEPEVQFAQELEIAIDLLQHRVDDQVFAALPAREQVGVRARSLVEELAEDHVRSGPGLSVTSQLPGRADAHKSITQCIRETRLAAELFHRTSAPYILSHPRRWEQPEMSTLDRGAAMLSDWLATAADFVQGSTVSLAVTGLSRAGKTVFITSLAHNLLSAMHQPYRMPLLRVVGDGRLIAARLAQASAGPLPRFPYQGNVERMAATPADWPTRTRDISEVEVEIRFMPTGAFGFVLDQLGSRNATLRLRI